MARVRAEMNLTPLIDILLVLLVIFLVALPLTEEGIDTQLPSETQSAGQEAPPDQIVLDYEASGRVTVNRQEVALQDLQERLRDIYRARRDKTIFVSGAGTLKYQAIIDVLDAAKAAGVDRVGIITEGMRRAARR